MKKTLLLVFLIPLLSCSPKKEKSWVFERNNTADMHFRSSRIISNVLDQPSSMQLEFLSVDGNLRMYVNLSSQKIPAYDAHTDEALVTLEIDGKTKHIIAARLAGEQRLLMPSDAASVIIAALIKGMPVSLSLSQSRGLFEAENFDVLFKKQRASHKN